MTLRLPPGIALAWLLPLLLVGAPLHATRADTLVRITTSLGTIDVALNDAESPLAVANFLGHVDAGNYENTMIRYADPGFDIAGIAGGRFRFDGSAQVEPRNYPLVPACPAPPIQCPLPYEPVEPGPRNLRGTIAMEPLFGLTNDWFINLADNTGRDDNPLTLEVNDGAPVFGRVVRDGMQVVDAIASLPRFVFEAPWGSAPMRDYTVQQFVALVPVDGDNVVLISSIERIPNADGDFFTDAEDNCPTRNRNQDFDEDGVGDACDSCLTIANSGTDPDMDGVDQACDTCSLQPNPGVAGLLAGRTLVSSQPDDDADGRGNACDFDYDQIGIVITSADFSAARASVGKLLTQSNCGVDSAGKRCVEFDHDGSGTVVTSADFNLTKAATGKLISEAFPTCAGCSVAAGWSNLVYTLGARVGRPICESTRAGACAYAP